MDENNNTIFHRANISEKSVSELSGLAKGMTADGVLNDTEIEFLQTWLVANQSVIENPVINILFQRISEIMEDGIIDDEERKELFETLEKFSGDRIEIGELAKPTNLPLCNPVPDIVFEDRTFCFTGTFAYGNRKDCEKAVEKRGGLFSGLTKRTDFCVIGSYVSDAWKHQSFGRKIERAVEYRQRFDSPAIITEAVWQASL